MEAQVRVRMALPPRQTVLVDERSTTGSRQHGKARASCSTDVGLRLRLVSSRLVTSRRGLYGLAISSNWIAFADHDFRIGRPSPRTYRRDSFAASRTRKLAARSTS